MTDPHITCQILTGLSALAGLVVGGWLGTRR